MKGRPAQASRGGKREDRWLFRQQSLRCSSLHAAVYSHVRSALTGRTRYQILSLPVSCHLQGEQDLSGLCK